MDEQPPQPDGPRGPAQTLLRRLRALIPTSPLPWRWHVRINRGLLAGILVLAAGGAVASVLLQRAGGGDEAAARAALWRAAALLLGASILRGLFTMWHNYQGEAIGQRIAYDLRMAYYAQLQRLSFGFHDRVHTGELITRGMLDIEGIRTVINAGLIRLVLFTLLVGIGAGAVMEAALSWTIEYTRERKAFGKSIAEFQNTRFKLAEVKTEVTVARVFLDHCLELFLEGKVEGERAGYDPSNSADQLGRRSAAGIVGPHGYILR